MTKDPMFWFNVINVAIVVASLAITVALTWPEDRP
jgi:hypothetical protein